MPTEKNWHALDITEVLDELGVKKASGLTEKEVKARLKKYGPNEIKKETEFRFLKIVWRQVKSPLVFILIVAGVISWFLEDYADTTIIFIAVLINTVIGAVQEGRASKTFSELKKTLKKYAIVIRDGAQRQIEAKFIIPGDIVLLREGDSVPADARIIEAKGLEVNEAALTGEWMPVSKNSKTVDEGERVTDRTDMVWMGTIVSGGWGRAVVVGTGGKTELGSIAELIQGEETSTPFQRGVSRLARYIGIFVAVSAVIIFALGVFRSLDITQVFLTSVAVAVAAVPEGLPVAVTVVLAAGMSSILKQGGLVRRLVAAETLGSTTTIFTDKTGTLTQAKMQVSEIFTPDEIFYHKTGKHLAVPRQEVLKGGVIASGAFIENPEDELSNWKIRGRATDQALLRAGIESGINPNNLLQDEKRIDFLSFEADRRFGASLNNFDGKNRIYVAGAPETILKMSEKFLVGENSRRLSQKHRKEINETYFKATSKGSRLIGIARKDTKEKEFKHGHKDVFEDLVFVGLIAFHDPLRPDVPAVVRKAREAGIRVVMVTGDHERTAYAVAREGGLVSETDEKDGQAKVVSGSVLEGKNPGDVARIIENTDVFARVLPAQKMSLVEVLQKKNEIIAMTGDGVNDAPALRRADIGVAVGSGTDVAKESSDLVLLKDSFKVLVAAIERGRVILDNLRKVITYVLSTGFSEIILIAFSLIAGLPLPVLPAQILWANIVGEGFMNFALAFEPKEDDVMKRNPRKSSSKKIFTREMIYLIFGIGIITNIYLLAVFLYMLASGFPLEEIRTVIFVGLVLDSVFFAFSLKSLRRSLWKINILDNAYFLYAWITSIALLAAAIYVPAISRLLGTVPLNAVDFGLLGLLALLNLASIEAAKWYFINKSKFGTDE